ncbi:MAG TPA: hypothetical protein VFB50_00760 [Chloroflexota bacterium]|nr:hypothetical protein [Chloroflexota bacterium]
MPTLANYRSTFSVEAGPYIGPDSYDVRAMGGSTVSQLFCHAYPIESGIPQTDQLIDRPLYRPQAVQATDKHRYVQAYAPSQGLITPDLVWALPPIADVGVGTEYQNLESFTYGELETQEYGDLENTGLTGFGERFEILGPFDAPTTHRLINDGLKNCWLIVEVVATPTPLINRHDLGTVCPWLQDPNDILQLGVLHPPDDRNMVDPFENVVHGMVERDGGTMYLNTGTTTFVDGDTLYLRCLKRAYDHCRASGGTYGDQSGLVLETDESPVDRVWAASAALAIAWRRFAHVLEVGANQRLIRDQAAAAAWFTDECRKHFTAPLPQRTLRRRRYFGPPRQLAGQYLG